MIRIENLTKSFGDRLIFDGISFALTSKQRVGLVGQNGHGKTTLFQMINGDEQPDSGSVVIPKNYRIAYVQQLLEFTADTALAEGLRALPPQEPPRKTRSAPAWSSSQTEPSSGVPS